MATDNETVAAIVSEIKERASGVNVRCDGLVEDVSQDEVWDACDRIEAAHKRELIKAIKPIEENYEYALEQIDAKDAEIAELERKYADACKCCDDAERRLKVAEDARTELQARCVASVHDGTIDPYEALKIVEEALAAIREQVTDCSQLKGENDGK